MKNSNDTIGNRTRNVWLVAQCLNQLRHRVPHWKVNIGENIKVKVSLPMPWRQLGGAEVHLRSFINSAIHGRWFISRPGCFAPRKNPGSYRIWGWGGGAEPFWMFRGRPEFPIIICTDYTIAQQSGLQSSTHISQDQCNMCIYRQNTTLFISSIIRYPLY